MPQYDYATGKGSPSWVNTLTELVAGFVPGLNMAQSLRDYQNASNWGEKITSAAGMVPGLGPAAKGSAMLMGALGPGIKLSHLTDPASLLVKDGKLRSEFYNMSLGLTKNGVMPMGKPGGALVVPKVDKFDPKTGGTDVFPYSAGTGGWSEASGRAANYGAATKENASRRLSERLTPFSDNTGREFSSFEDFSNRGAKKLQDWSLDKDPNKSRFGEVKRWGPVPFTGDNFHGAILPEEHFNSLSPDVLQQYAKRGMEVRPYSKQEDLIKLLSEMQTQGVK